MGPDAENPSNNCAECGSELESGAKYCTKCGNAAGEEERRKSKPRVPKEPVQPWAIKAGDRVKKIPRRVKFGVPVAILVIVAIIVALWVLASLHTPEATVNRYMSLLKQGDYKGAHELIAEAGRFTSLRYFEDWQNLQAEKLGTLTDYAVTLSKNDTKLFGHLILEDQPVGTPFTVTFNYKDKSYDATIAAEGAGGTWPFNRYRLRLSDQTTRVIASAQGTEIYIDGTLAGTATQNEFLKAALSLGDFPSDFGQVPAYAKALFNTATGAVDEFKRLALQVSNVTQDVQHTFNKFGGSGLSWTQVVDSFQSVTSSSKDLWSSLARTAIHIYWIFGGGNDGSVRAKLSRAEYGVDIKNLPEGFHQVRVVLPGCIPSTQDFYAPNEEVVEVKPTARTTQDLKAALQGYYSASSIAMFTLDTSGLPAVTAGTLLEEENKKVVGLINNGERVASQLTSLKYEKTKMLSSNVATLEVTETWNYTTYRGNVPISSLTGVKQHVVYTLQLESGVWKVTEQKVL